MTNWCSKWRKARAMKSLTMLREQMAAAKQLAVPLKVEIGSGGNWDQAH